MRAPGDTPDGHVDGPVDRPMPRQPDPGPINSELALTLMSRIWSAGIEVAAIGALIGDGPLSDKATAIVGELDSVIRDIRAGASAAAPARSVHRPLFGDPHDDGVNPKTRIH